VILGSNGSGAFDETTHRRIARWLQGLHKARCDATQ